MPALTYPSTRTIDAMASHAGVERPDPYRWLEKDSAEVRRWQNAQNEVADNYVRAWSGYPTLRSSVSHFSADRHTILPRFAGGTWFRVDSVTADGPTVVVASNTPYGDGRVVNGLDQHNARTTVVTWLAPSRDGRVLALGICEDGSENNKICLVDARRGELLSGAPPQYLMDSWTGGVCWLPDNSGFYFLALVGERQQFRQQVLFHSMANQRQTAAAIPLPQPESADYTLVALSPEGRYLVASHSLLAPRPVAILDLQDANAAWRPFITKVEDTVAGFVMHDRFIALTDVHAPRGRVVAIPLYGADPNDPGCWSEVVPETDAVIRSVNPVGDYLYLTEFVDTYSRVRVVDLTGSLIDFLTLPANPAVTEELFPLLNLIPEAHPNEYVFSCSSLVESWGVYRHRPGQRTIETLKAPQIVLKDLVIEDHWATSTDGTRIPYHSVRLVDTDPAQPQPCLIHAYGGFNVPRPPEFPGGMTAFVMTGGIYVHAHIRGGAEYGKAWWEGGRLKQKQNCYQDLYAVARHLIDSGRTTPDHLALTGRSNGGLLAGVALAQRPMLWKAVVPQVPILDLLGALRYPYGRYCVEIDYGNPNDADDLLRVLEFSAYHLIADGTHYPAVFMVAGETDPRCPPWHARKFAARLQAANSGDSPVLVRIWEHSGHGLATSKPVQLDMTSAWLAFVMQQLQMEV